MHCGVDIGGTNTKIGLVDDNGKIIDHCTVQSSLYEEANDLVVTIAYNILRMAKVNGTKIEGLGIGCPNVNPYDGTLENAANLRFKKKVSLKDLFRQYFPEIPIAVDNDANAATIGEQVYGSAKGLDNFILVTLGTGVGSGIVCQGKLLYGLNGMAGEIGHMIVEPEGRDCGCGRKGCLEQYVAAEGIHRTYRELCQKQGLPCETKNYREMSVLAQNGDPLALAAYENAGKYLGSALANIACVTAPTHIFLFGGVAQAGDLLLNPTRKYFNENLLFCYADAIRIELSGLMTATGNAAIAGAAALSR